MSVCVSCVIETDESCCPNCNGPLEELLLTAATREFVRAVHDSAIYTAYTAGQNGDSIRSTRLKSWRDLQERHPHVIGVPDENV